MQKPRGSRAAPPPPFTLSQPGEGNSAEKPLELGTAFSWGCCTASRSGVISLLSKLGKHSGNHGCFVPHSPQLSPPAPLRCPVVLLQAGVGGKGSTEQLERISARLQKARRGLERKQSTEQSFLLTGRESKTKTLLPVRVQGDSAVRWHWNHPWGWGALRPLPGLRQTQGRGERKGCPVLPWDGGGVCMGCAGDQHGDAPGGCPQRTGVQVGGLGVSTGCLWGCFGEPGKLHWGAEGL